MLSRVADSLFWMARYLERAEHAALAVEAHLNLSLGREAGHDDGWRLLREALSCPAGEGEEDTDPYAGTYAIAFDTVHPGSIRSNITAARESARQVREQVSTEMFMQLNALYFRVQQTRLEDIWNGEPFEFFRSIHNGSHLFHGITDAGVSHDQGWFFIQLGRYLERAQCMTRMLKVYLHDTKASGQRRAFEADRYLSRVGLLRACSAYEPYLRRYRHGLRSRDIARFLLLDDNFPRSVRFSADRIQGAVHAITRDTGHAHTAALERLAGRLRGQLEFAEISEVLDHGLGGFIDQLLETSNEIGAQVYRAYIGYPITEFAS